MKNIEQAKNEYREISSTIVKIMIKETKHDNLIWKKVKYFPDIMDFGDKFNDFIQMQLSDSYAFLSSESYFSILENSAIYYCLSFINLKSGEKMIIPAVGHLEKQLFVDLYPTDMELSIRLYNLIKFSDSDDDTSGNDKLNELKSALDSLNDK